MDEAQGIMAEGEAQARRLARIPVWAQDRMAHQDRRNAELTRRIAQLSEGPGESDTYVNGLGLYPDRELGKGVEVTFRLPDGSVVRAAIRGEYVELNSLGPDSRSEAIIAQPSSGNVLRVRSGTWW